MLKEKGPDFSGPISASSPSQKGNTDLTEITPRVQLFAQPALWASVSLTCNVFAALSVFGGVR
jgi:hypothetical protein